MVSETGSNGKKVESLKTEPNSSKYQHNEAMGEYHKSLQEWSKNVDRQYAWVILAVLFLTFATILGTYRVYGIIFAKVTHDGVYTREEASWPVSMVFTIENTIGPLTSVITYGMSYRYSMLIGSLCVMLGNGLAYWSHSLNIDILLIGIIQGVGYSFVFIPFMGAINSYFLKYRNIALGFSLCGGTISVFLFTPLFRWLLDNFHWRFSYLSIGIICSVNMLLVPLLKPNPKPDPPAHASRARAAAAAAQKEGGMSFRALTYSSSMRRQSTILVRRNTIDQRNGSIISVNPFASTACSERKISRAIMVTKTSTQPKRQQSVQAHHLTPKEGTSGSLDMPDAKSMHDIEVEIADTKFEWSIILDILKNPGFHIIWYLELTYFWIFGILCLVLVDFGLDRGCSPDEANDLMMFQSVGEMLGRMGLTIIADMAFMSHRNMVSLTLILLTALLCLFPFVNGLALIATFTVAINALASLLYILLNGLLVSVLGERKVTIGYGMASFVVGILIGFRPHAVGFFRDYIGSYELLMVSMGAACGLGTVFCVLEEIREKCCRSAKNDEKRAISAEERA